MLPLEIGRAIDCIHGIRQVEFERLTGILIRACICVIMTIALQWIMQLLNNRMSFRVVRDLRNSAFRRLQVLPLRTLDKQSAGDIVSRVIADADQVADGLLLGFTQLFTGVMTILGTLAFMLRLQATVALAVILITPLSFFVARFISTHTYEMFHRMSQTRGRQTALINEMISGQKVVQAFGQQKAVQGRFDSINRQLKEESLKATFYSSLTNPATRFVNSTAYAGVALIGGLTAIGGGMSVGALTSLLSYANQYTKPFNEISGVITELQNALACASRLFELIESEAQESDAIPQVDLREVSGQVDIKDVFFSYRTDMPLIEHFNLAVRPGMRVAIVGPTGCGKTTLINLLMRFYDADSGSIEIDATDIRKVTRSSLRSQYGMVLQDTWLRTGTIRENLKLGNPEASDEEMIEKAKAAHADSFIRKLPQGYDTVIGSEGGSLSQGQMQLLSITRVMLCNPAMLILDEATSSIDTRTEQYIQEAFRMMMENRTSFIVAHRLSTIEGADIILVMQNGKILETGTHRELLKKGGFYARLYNSQFAA